MRPMNRLLWSALVVLSSSLVAQKPEAHGKEAVRAQSGQDPKGQDAKSPEAKSQDPKGGKPEEHKDDALTAKDPAIVALDKFIKTKAGSQSDPTWRTKLPEPPQQAFNAACDYVWHMETSLGGLDIQLYPEVAPMHVTSIVYLARLGYFDGLKFHRVLKGFMAQGGCPLGTGTGGPGYLMDYEGKGEHKHDRPGMLSFANTGRPKSEGSQFFLTFVPVRALDGKYTIAGGIVDGLETLKALEAAGIDPRMDGQPLPNPPKILRSWIKVAPKPAKAEEPNADGAKTPAEAKPAKPAEPKGAGGETGHGPG